MADLVGREPVILVVGVIVVPVGRRQRREPWLAAGRGRGPGGTRADRRPGRSDDGALIAPTDMAGGINLIAARAGSATGPRCSDDAGRR